MMCAFPADHVRSGAEARAAAAAALAWRRSTFPRQAAFAAPPQPAKPPAQALRAPRPVFAPTWVSSRMIVEASAAHFNVSVKDVLGRSRIVTLVSARHVAAWLIRDMRGQSLPQTARFLKRSDHTTVLHACRHVEATPALLNAARQIRAALTTPAPPAEAESTPDGSLKGAAA
jgi:hypothetical protein